jgi:hypothetical protein
VGYGNWINGNNYEQTQEVFGILPFDAAVRQDLGMLQYNEQFAKDQSTRHQWLSKQQRARFAVLPFHTQDERHLFHLYAENSPLFTSLNGQPDFTGLCKRMNEHADGKSFFYKVRLYTGKLFINQPLTLICAAARACEELLQVVARLPQ